MEKFLRTPRAFKVTRKLYTCFISSFELFNSFLQNTRFLPGHSSTCICNLRWHKSRQRPHPMKQSLRPNSAGKFPIPFTILLEISRSFLQAHQSVLQVHYIVSF